MNFAYSLIQALSHSLTHSGVTPFFCKNSQVESLDQFITLTLSLISNLPLSYSLLVLYLFILSFSLYTIYYFSFSVPFFLPFFLSSILLLLRSFFVLVFKTKELTKALKNNNNHLLLSTHMKIHFYK